MPDPEYPVAIWPFWKHASSKIDAQTTNIGRWCVSVCLCVNVCVRVGVIWCIIQDMCRWCKNPKQQVEEAQTHNMLGLLLSGFLSCNLLLLCSHMDMERPSRTSLFVNSEVLLAWKLSRSAGHRGASAIVSLYNSNLTS